MHLIYAPKKPLVIRSLVLLHNSGILRRSRPTASLRLLEFDQRADVAETLIRTAST
jgi:hypothetical protein